MDRLEFSTGGFPMSTERLASMQGCWAQVMEALTAAVCGQAEADFVVSGCGAISDRGPSGSEDGWMVVGGELLPFRKGGRGGYVGVFEEAAETLEYQDGERRTFRTSRYAALQAAPNGHALHRFGSLSGGARSLSALWGLAARQAALDAALERIRKLEQGLAALGGGTQTDLDELRRQMVPRGAVVMWGGALPIFASAAREVIDGMAAVRGWVPCGWWPAAGTAAPAAWNGYFEDIGLPAAARFAPGAAGLNFEALARQAGVAAPDLSGRFPLGAGPEYPLGSTGGKAKVALAVSELPPHSHRVLGLHRTVKHSGNRSWTLDEGGRDPSPAQTAMAGGGQPHENMPPYAAVNWIVKVV